jgi:hypothetical protein
MKIKTILFLLITSGIFSSQSDLLAQVQPSFSFDISYSAVKGGFDGETMLTAGGESGILIPKLKGNYGFAISLGIGEDYYLGIKYARSQYDAAFLGESLGKANYNLFVMEFKWFYPIERRKYSYEEPIIKFFLPSGLEIGLLKLENAFFISSSNSYQDATLTSMGIPVGIGLAIQPIKAFSINFDVGYRIATVVAAKKSGISSAESRLGEWVGIGGFNCEVGFYIYP